MSNSSADHRFVEKREANLFSEPAPSVNAPKALPGPRTLAIAPPLSSFALSDEQAGASLQHFFTVIRRYRWKLAALMALALLVTGLATSQLTPLYESKLALNVERRGNAVGAEQIILPSSSEMDQIMTTQIELVESDPVLRPVAEKYHLLDLENQFRWLNESESRRLRNATIVLKRLKVARVPNTSILRISYRAIDPVLTADIVAMIGKSYMEHAFDARQLSSSAVSVVVSRQLSELKEKMISSDGALAAFARELHFVDPEQRVNVLSARLLQLNTEYTAAQSERLHKEALLKATTNGTLAGAQVSGQSAMLDSAITRLNQSKNEFARVTAIYGEGHPEYQKASRELNEMQRQFDEIRANTVDRVSVDYRQTLEREKMANNLLAETRAEVDGLTARAFDYQRLKNDADNYRKLYDDLERITREQVINRSFQESILQIVDPARPAARHVFPNMPLNLAAGFLLSVIIGVGTILILDNLDKRVRTPEDAAKLANVDVIAALPRIRKPLQGRGVVGTMPKNRRTRLLLEYQESIRGLRNSIISAVRGQACRSLVIASSSSNGSVSSIVANLGFSYALLGRKVLLIDANLREPSLHKVFEKSAGTGVSDVMARRMAWQETLVQVAREQLFLMPAGEMNENSSDLISVGMRNLLETASEQFDLILIVTPPVLAAPESVPVASAADGVLVLAQAEATTSGEISDAYAALRRAGANIIGMAMNDVRGLAKPRLSIQGRGTMSRKTV